jgi:hypothetical protein
MRKAEYDAQKRVRTTDEWRKARNRRKRDRQRRK